MTARQVVLDHENPGQFEALRQGVIQQAQPNNVLEWQFTEYLAVLLWRLRRASCFESALLQAIDNEHRLEPAAAGITLGGVFIPTTVQNRQGAQIASQYVEYVETHSTRLARIVRSAIGDTDHLSKLGRYEAHLLRQIENTMKVLCRHAT